MAFTDVLFSPKVTDEQERKGLLAKRERNAEKAFFDMGANSTDAPYANTAPSTRRPEEGMAGLFSNPEPNLMNFNGDQGSPQRYSQTEQPKKKGNFGEGLMKVLPLILGAISGGLMLGPMGIPMGLMYGMGGVRKGQLEDRELDINDQYKQGSINAQNAGNLEDQSWHNRQWQADKDKLTETNRANLENERINNEKLKNDWNMERDLPILMENIQKIKNKNRVTGTDIDPAQFIPQANNQNSMVPGPNDRIIQDLTKHVLR